MIIDLKNYSFQEVIELKKSIDEYLNKNSDGYVYICNVSSYGRVWVEKPKNIYTLKELCKKYLYSDDGRVDVYTSNHQLGDDFKNYGCVKTIKSEEDYNKWLKFSGLKKIIEDAEKHFYEFMEDQEKPFIYRRFSFGPKYNLEEIKELKKELSGIPIDFEEPLDYFNGK